MKVKDLIDDFGFELVAGAEGIDNTIDGVYIGDLLSWVMGKAGEDNAWITILGHVNIVAVALLTSVSCIIIAEGAEVDSETIRKADSEDIPILVTELSSFEVSKKFVKVLGV